MKALDALQRWISPCVALCFILALRPSVGQNPDRPERVIPPRSLNAVAFGNGTFVAVGSGTTIFTSRDGTNWINRSANVDNLVIGLNFDWETYTHGGDSVTLVFSDQRFRRPVHVW